MISARLERKSDYILNLLKENKSDWEETFYRLLAHNFGFQLNAMPFEMLARSLPLKFVRKENDKQILIEAMLFGQAGMLHDHFNEQYPVELNEHYKHLSKKYTLQSIPFATWKFLRLRPVNFPAIRIAQFAALLCKSHSLFDDIISCNSSKDFMALFNISASDYWDTHFHFNKSSGLIRKKLGKNSVFNVVINTCIPFIYTWGKYSGNEKHCLKAIKMLNEIPAEINHIISEWQKLKLNVTNAAHSQALLELKSNHCDEKKCLSCKIGNKLINALP
jgi:hypothetical protein